MTKLYIVTYEKNDGAMQPTEIAVFTSKEKAESKFRDYIQELREWNLGVGKSEERDDLFDIAMSPPSYYETDGVKEARVRIVEKCVKLNIETW